MDAQQPDDRQRLVSREDLEAILDSLEEGLVTLDREGQIIGINRAACEILEADRAEALRSDCCSLLGRQLCESAAAIRESIRHRRRLQSVDVTVRTTSGVVKVLTFQTYPLRDERREEGGSVVLFRDVTELTRLKEDLASRYRLHNIVGKSKPMQDVFALVREVADSDATVLIEGESGTGKERVARAIHHLGPRSEGPFVAVNCSALAEGILESELFGHVEGAFTGAARDKPGRFEIADGGTIFLDEIGDLAPAIQVKLLRILQERTVERVGSNESRAADLRVIAATHRPLAEMVARGDFRQDLYYRLRVVPIHLPPLRGRRDDLPLLAQHFVEKFRTETGRKIDGVSREAMSLMLDYAWPGNVRELENAIEYAFVKVKGGQIGPEHLPPELTGHAPASLRLDHAHGARPPHTAPREASDLVSIRQTLEETDWNIAKAARRLGISRTTLYKRIAELELQRPAG